MTAKTRTANTETARPSEAPATARARDSSWIPGKTAARIIGVLTFFKRKNLADMLVIKQVIDAGDATPAIGRTYPLDAAQESVRTNEGLVGGKVVITVDRSGDS